MSGAPAGFRMPSYNSSEVSIFQVFLLYVTSFNGHGLSHPFPSLIEENRERIKSVSNLFGMLGVRVNLQKTECGTLLNSQFSFFSDFK